MQQGQYAAGVVMSRLKGDAPPPPFRYHDRGNMAVIGRSAAVADIHGKHISGFIAWLAWLFIHLLYLAQFQNRVLVMIQWTWNYLTRNRSARLITGVERRPTEHRDDGPPDHQAPPHP
jgi:NADH:ubiquinone reductase (H+-translocating)